MEIKIKAGQYQDKFLLSEHKFPAMISAVGTGKTLCLLAKVYKYLEDWPKSTGLIVRREFSDLKDSTMKDFESYFNCKIGVDKNYTLANGSMVMFRHASEFEVLKNVNLSIVGIEQIDEFETDDAFQFLRDRLRQKNGARVRPLCVIGNANGHNWVWKAWINTPECYDIDTRTGQAEYINGEYHGITANTWANEENLPPDFIADLKRKEVEAPRHFNQYVMNSFEEQTQDDYVFSFSELMAAKARAYTARQGYGHRVMGFDIARFGNDKCAAVGIQQVGSLAWIVFHVEQWDHKDLDYTTGRILATSQHHNVMDNIIDEDGIGSGPLDFITKGRKRDDFKGFRNPGLSYEDDQFYANHRTRAAFRLKDYVSKGWIAIPDEGLIQELMTLRYKFNNDGRRVLISKDEMRKQGIKSPNMADAFIMAGTLMDIAKESQDRQYYRPPSVAKEDNLYQLAGVR